jgi:hypothetical protein
VRIIVEVVNRRSLVFHWNDIHSDTVMRRALSCKKTTLEVSNPELLSERYYELQNVKLMSGI